MHASKIIFGKIIFGVPAAAENLQSPPLHTPSRGINLRLHPVHLHPRHLVTIGSSALTDLSLDLGLSPPPNYVLHPSFLALLCLPCPIPPPLPPPILGDSSPLLQLSLLHLCWFSVGCCLLSDLDHVCGLECVVNTYGCSHVLLSHVASWAVRSEACAWSGCNASDFQDRM